MSTLSDARAAHAIADEPAGLGSLGGRERRRPAPDSPHSHVSESGPRQAAKVRLTRHGGPIFYNLTTPWGTLAWSWRKVVFWRGA